jgi:uncharacterized membrane protein
VFTLMSSRDPLYQIYFQYTVFWAPTSFLLMFMILRRKFVETARDRALIANASAILLTTLLTSYFYGSIFESPKMQGGFGAISYDWTEADEKRLDAFHKLSAMIPPDASVAATSREVPHLSNRRNAYSLPIGYFDADYLLVRKQHVGRRQAARKAYKEALDTRRYERIATEDIFMLWKRTDEPEEAP